MNVQKNMHTTVNSKTFQASMATTTTIQDKQNIQDTRLTTSLASPTRQVKNMQSTSVSTPNETSAMHETKVSPQPRAWIPGQPQVALSVISSRAAPIPRNIHGDAAWPPVRPPSSGPAEAEARFQTDQGAAASAALEAWRKPSQPVPDDVVADAFAEMMRMVSPRPSTTQVPLSSTAPIPLPQLPPPHIPSSIDMELLKDPEAEVRGLSCEPAPPPDRAATRYYTNKEANKRGALTVQPRTRQARGYTREGMLEVRPNPAPPASGPAVPQVVARPADRPTGVDTLVACPRGASSAGPALDGAPGPSGKEGHDTADPRILQAPPPLAEPGGGGGDESRGERGPGCSDNSERLTTESTGDQRHLQSPSSPAGLPAVGGRSGAGDSGGPPARLVTISNSSTATDHGASAANGTGIENTVAAVPPLGDIPVPRAEGTPTERSIELETMSGSQLLPKGSRVRACRRWTARIGVWLDDDGVLSARVLEGVASTPREAYVLPSSGGIVGHCWNLGLDRILGPVAETADARKAADGRVSNLLEQIGDELDEIRDGAEVHSATGMQSVLVTVLRLLAGVTRSGERGRASPADPRILQAPPPLAEPEGGEGVESRGERGPGCSDNSERLTTESTGVHRHLRSPTSPEGPSAVCDRSGAADSGGPPARLVTISNSSQTSDHGASAAHSTGKANPAAAVPPLGDIPVPRTAGTPTERSIELETLSGSQLLPKGSRVRACRRWTARIGVWLDDDGVLSARVLEGVASTPREAYVLPSSGGIVGHCWNLGLDRILGPVAETADARKAADGRVSRRLEQIGDELDEIRDGAEVHDAGSMQSVMLRVLRLLAGATRSSGCGQAGPADPQVLQPPPPLARPGDGGEVEPRVVQNARRLDGTGCGGLPQITPRRSEALPAGRARPLITLQDFMPADHTSGPHLGARGTIAPDPIAWRASILATPPPPPQPQRVVVSVPLQRPLGKQKQQWAQPSRPERAAAHCRLPLQPNRQPVTLLPEEQAQQSDLLRPRAPPVMGAPIRLRNYFGVLAVDAEEEIEPEETDHYRTPHRLTGHGRQSRSENRGRRGRQQQAHGPQAAQQSGRRRQRKATVATEDSAEPLLDEAELVGAEPQPTARPLGGLSARPEFQGQPHSASESGIPHAQRMRGWSVPRPHPRSAAFALHVIAEEGPVSSRIRSAGRSSLSLKTVHGGLDPPYGTGTREGTAHRSVRWGRPSAPTRAYKADLAPRASAESVHGTDVRPPDQSRAGRPLAVRHPPPLVLPEGGGESNVRGVRGLGSASGSEPRCATSSPARVDLYAARERGNIVAPLRLGTESRSQQVLSEPEFRAVVRDGASVHNVPVTLTDWTGFDHFRHGASPDLIVALCLRRLLGCSELVRVELISHDSLLLHPADWPASWEEFGAFVASGGSFRVGASLRGGMDPTRKGLLDKVHFATDTDWELLDRCLEAVRSQVPLPAGATPEQRTIAELMSEATPLRQWALMETVPEIQGRCDATPARMTALALLLARPRVRVRRFPPCVVEGQAGQHVELRFNSIPPPPNPASGGAVSAETIKDGVLSQLEVLAPAMWADPAFGLRVVRKSMRLEGNLAALQTFSLTVLLPFGAWITAFLKGELSLGSGSYATVAPFGTHVEVELTPQDHAVFRAIRLSLGLSHADSLELLEDGLSRALGNTPVACRFTTSRRIVSGGGGGGAKGKPSYVHHAPDDEGASTLFTIEAASLVVARRKGLYISFSLGEGDDQRPLALKMQLPVCPPAALHRMVESRVTPPLRSRDVGTLFVHSNVLIGPLPANWMTDKITHSSSEEERLRRVSSLLWKGCVQAEDIHFVGRRDKGDRNPMFLYVEFPGLAEACAFGATMDSKSLPAALTGFWNTWMGDRPVHLWSCALLTEALEVVPFKAWKGLMELGMQSPCPPPDPGVNAGSV